MPDFINKPGLPSLQISPRFPADLIKKRKFWRIQSVLKVAGKKRIIVIDPELCDEDRKIPEDD